MNPIAPFVEHQGVMVLDGGLATALEAQGWDLDHELWSAKVLLEAPDAIKQVHLDFLAAGADCITSSTYQASLSGFQRSGLSEIEGEEGLRSSVRLAIEARDTFWSDPYNRRGGLRPLVAASIRPYGAFLADGSEYTGRYEIDDNELYAFHRSRWRVLAQSAAVLLESCSYATQLLVVVALPLNKERELPVHTWGRPVGGQSGGCFFHFRHKRMFSTNNRCCRVVPLLMVWPLLSHWRRVCPVSLRGCEKP